MKMNKLKSPKASYCHETFSEFEQQISNMQIKINKLRKENKRLRERVKGLRDDIAEICGYKNET